MFPANDNFANATVISGSSGIVNGGNVGATIEAGEPLVVWPVGTQGSTSLVSKSPVATVWYKWTAPFSGQCFFSTEGFSGKNFTSFRSTIQIFKGTTLSGLTEIPYIQDQRQGVGDGWEYGARVGFDVTGIGDVYIRVDTRDGNTGQFILKWGAFSAPRLGACSQCPIDFESYECLASVSISDTTVDSWNSFGTYPPMPGLFKMICCNASDLVGGEPVLGSFDEPLGAYIASFGVCNQQVRVGADGIDSNWFEDNPHITDNSTSYGSYWQGKGFDGFGGWNRWDSNNSYKAGDKVMAKILIFTGREYASNIPCFTFCQEWGYFNATWVTVAHFVCVRDQPTAASNPIPDGDPRQGLPLCYSLFQPGLDGGAYWVEVPGLGWNGDLNCFETNNFCHTGGDIGIGWVGNPGAPTTTAAGLPLVPSFRLVFNPMWPFLSLSTTVPFESPVGTSHITINAINSASLTWPGVTCQLIGTTSSAAVTNDIAANANPQGFQMVYATPATMPYDLNFEFRVCGVVSGVKTVTVQPIISASVTSVLNCGFSGKATTFTIKNNGLGASKNLKADIFVINDPTHPIGCNVAGTQCPFNGWTPQNGFFNLLLSANLQPGGIVTPAVFGTNIGGTTVLNCRMNLRDDTFTYPPLFFQITV